MRYANDWTASERVNKNNEKWEGESRVEENDNWDKRLEPLKDDIDPIHGRPWGVQTKRDHFNQNTLRRLMESWAT